MAWQPIETAPTDRLSLFFEIFDGGPKWGRVPRPYIGGWWEGDALNRAGWVDASRMYANPTHWQPIPDPPDAL